MCVAYIPTWVGVHFFPLCVVGIHPHLGGDTIFFLVVGGDILFFLSAIGRSGVPAISIFQWGRPWRRNMKDFLFVAYYLSHPHGREYSPVAF